MADEKDKYDGDYKVGISDKGRVTFNLNFKWVLAIAMTILSFVGYLLLDKYFITPMESKDIKIESLEKNDAEKGDKIDILIQNQKILLDRSERTQKFIDSWIESNQLTISNHTTPEVSSTTPGQSSTPGNSPLATDSIN